MSNSTATTEVAVKTISTHEVRQLLDRKVGCVAHRDERAAVGDELLQVRYSIFADAAAIFRPNRRRVVSADDVLAREPLIG